MARIRRRELKQDEFISAFEQSLEFLEEQREMLIALVRVVVVGAGSLGGWWWHARRQEQRASLALGQALELYAAPIRLNPGESPANIPGPSFANEKEKYEAAQKAFADLRREFARTRVGVIAKHYEGLALWELGKQEEALRLLEEVSHAARRERAAVARLHLAGRYLKLDRKEEARQLYQKLAARPTGSVPRAVALLALADLIARTEPAEARKLYEEVKRELGESSLAAEIDRRLALLPPAP
ncbi:MAG: tol-pal system YbgF family protein [Terriglobia bacterium]